MGKLIPLRVQSRREDAMVTAARDVQEDALAAIRLVASISARLKSIDQFVAEIAAPEEREAAQAAATKLRETVRSAFGSVSNEV